jgi:ribonuclease H2 subunit B
MTPIDPTFLLIPIMQAMQPVRLNIYFIHQNTLFFMKLDGSTAQFRTADDIFEEAAKRLGKPPAVDSSSTETYDTLVLPQDIIDLWSLKCIRKAIRSICDIKGSSSARNQPFRHPSYILFRHFG